MDNSLTDNLIPTFSGDYIALTEFRARMEQDVLSPYQARFSISTLIKEFKRKNALLKNDPLDHAVIHLEGVEAKLREMSWEALSEQGDLDTLMVHMFPSFFFKDQMGFIKGPFESNDFRFQTDDFLVLLANENWEVKVSSEKFMHNGGMQNILLAGAIVLNTFYGQNVDIYSSEGMTLRDRVTKTERHFKFNIQLDYLEAKALKPLKKLSTQQIHRLLNNLDDPELWIKYIPPENFFFEGFVIGVLSDVTKTEILSTLKEMAGDEGGKSDHEDDLNYIEILVRSYINIPDLQFGVLQTVSGPWLENLTWCLLRNYDTELVTPSLEDPESAYGKVLKEGTPVIVEDLQKQKHLSPLEAAVLELDLRSLLLAPMKDNEGNVISILELGSAKPYSFNQLTLLQLRDFIAQIEVGSNKFIQQMDNSVRLTIQQEFTSIHPSVEWKFRKVASKYFWDQTVDEKQGTLDPIVFKEVYPLYGQADIVSSSKKRNKSIQTDLMDNLGRLHQLLVDCRKAVRFHLFDVYADKVQAHFDRLEKGEMVSSDESVIVELLNKQIHPLLRKLRLRFPQLPQESLDAYFDYLDPELDIVYRSRKAYETSVSMLNQAISNYLLEEEHKMQQVLPHYFEKFQTDGVEYNLYLGESILEEGEFHDFYLRDFRLWQLILMCEITKLVEERAKTFPVQLSTAQLIFIFNSSLSIRFEMDEKQFGVDGTYNVRYEILKKRIDKAYIKGTDERLTQAGKIAIVWLQEKDRQEYQEYLDHLVRNGYIDPEIEDLELEKMQGVEGLRAVRIKVNTDGPAQENQE